MQPKTFAFGLYALEPQTLKNQLPDLPIEAITALEDTYHALTPLYVSRRLTRVSALALVINVVTLFLMARNIPNGPVLILLNFALLLGSIFMLWKPQRAWMLPYTLIIALTAVLTIQFAIQVPSMMVWFAIYPILMSGLLLLLVIEALPRLLRHRRWLSGSPDPALVETIRALKTAVDAADPTVEEQFVHFRKKGGSLLAENVSVTGFHDRKEALVVPEGELWLELMVRRNSGRKYWPVRGRAGKHTFATSVPRQSFEHYAAWKQAQNPYASLEKLKLTGSHFLPDWLPFANMPTGLRIMFLVALALTPFIAFVLVRFLTFLRQYGAI